MLKMSQKLKKKVKNTVKGEKLLILDIYLDDQGFIGHILRFIAN